MHHYAYKAMDATGKLVRGRLAAHSALELEHSLHRLGLDLISFRPVSTKKIFSRAITRQDQASFCSEMEQLLRAGVPLLQALDELQLATDNAVLRLTIAHSKLAIEGGESLSQALSHHGHIFPQLLITLIHIGEVTGRLPEVFGHLASTISWHNETSRKLHRALIYPAMVLAIALASAAFMLAYLVPQMAAFFKSSGQSLPWQTAFMLQTSEHFSRYGWYWLGGMSIASISAVWILASSMTARTQWDGLKLRLPVIGPLLQKSIMARFTRYLALMYRAGIPLLDALEHCRDVAGNLNVASHLDVAIGDIRSGAAMSDSLQTTEIFPPLVVRMLHIGETTGNLDAALERASEYYERDIEHAIETLFSLLEPALTILLGGLMALIMLSILGPVYDAISEIRL